MGAGGACCEQIAASHRARQRPSDFSTIHPLTPKFLGAAKYAANSAHIRTPSRRRILAAQVKEEAMFAHRISRRSLIANAAGTAALGACVGVAPFALADAPAPEEAPVEPAETLEVDLVVVGAGGAGLATAHYAGKQGLNVLVLEKSGIVGGNSGVSEGLLFCNVGSFPDEYKAVMTPEMETYLNNFIEGGPINEDEEQHWDDLMAKYEAWRESGSDRVFDCAEFYAMDCLRSGEGGDFRFVDDWINGADAFEDYVWFFLEETGLQMDESVGAIGFTWPRFMRVKDGHRGYGWINGITDAIEKNGYPVEIRTDTSVDSLTVNPTNGAVTGVIAHDKNGAIEVKANKGVVIATGGFSRNFDWCLRYNTLWDYEYMTTILSDAQPFILGEGIAMSEEVGAATAHMNNVSLLPICNVEDGNQLTLVGSLDSFSLFTPQGERFISEIDSRDNISYAIIDLPEHFCYIVTDATNSCIEGGKTRDGADVEDMLDRGILYRADTLEELAEVAGMDTEKFLASVEKYNAACDGEPDEFGNVRLTEWNRIDEPPFYAYPIRPATHITMGGVVADENSRALRWDMETPIDGLFVVGEAKDLMSGLDGMVDGHFCARYIVENR